MSILRLVILLSFGFGLVLSGPEKAVGQMVLQGEKEAHALPQTPKDTADIVDLINQSGVLGNAYPDSALAMLHQALQESYRLNFGYGIAKSHQLIGIIYSHTGRFEKGIDHLRRLIYHCLATGEQTDLLALGYNIIGNIYQTQGKYEEAAFYYHKTLQLPREHLDESTICLIYVNLSRLTNRLKQPDKALYYLSRADAIANRNPSNYLTCIITSHRGMIYAESGQTDSAIFYLRKGQNLIRTLSQKSNIRFEDVEYTNMVYMADIWLQQGNTDSAAVCIRRIQEIKTPVVPLYWNKAHLVMGKYYAQIKNYRRAEYHLLTVLDSIQSTQANNDLANIHLALTHLYNNTQQYAKSVQHSLNYIRIKDSLENQEITNAVSQLEVRYRTAEKDKELISQKLEISRQQSDVRKKNLWITIVTAIMIVSGIMSMALYKKRQSDRRLQRKEIQILKQQQQALEQEQEIVRLKAMMKGEERERGRIARELHDGIGGMLTAMKMNLITARRKNPALADNESLTELMHMLEDTSSEVRKTAHNLMPDVLVQHALPEALMIFCNHIHKQLETELSCQGDFSQLDKATELMLYRMVQELIQNILKHASATRASIELIIYEGKLLLTVEDNGTGFDANQEQMGFGLQNLRYRVAALQGKISITSDAHKSTIVHLEFDLEKLKMD
jgi:signal transduction histidine kinase